MWICPACQSPLTLAERTYSCNQGHTFDRAKEGYVNLLLAQHKRSKEPGDNKEMVNARRAFLQQDYYQPLALHLAQLIGKYHVGRELAVFDVGCGEGYYLNCIIQSLLEASDMQITSGALDISKIAVQKAAKKYPDSHFAVASSFNLPVANDSQQAIIQIFAPSSADEVYRVLAEEGLWIQINPAPEHLQQLKKCIYDVPAEHKAIAPVPDGFDVLYDSELNFEFTLQSPHMRLNLLMMTPYYWTAPKDKVEVILATLERVKAHFSVRVLQKVTLS
jgi:23S rRNA (guanine745-N1)-methyltransferase